MCIFVCVLLRENYHTAGKSGYAFDAYVKRFLDSNLNHCVTVANITAHKPLVGHIKFMYIRIETYASSSSNRISSVMESRKFPQKQQHAQKHQRPTAATDTFYL